MQYKYSTRIFLGGEGKKALKIDWIMTQFLTYSLIEIIPNCLRMAVESSEVMMIFFLDLNL